MKTLLIVSSIILISFQIDRLLVNHFSDTGNNMEILSNSYSSVKTTANLPAANPDGTVVSLNVAAPETALLENAPKEAKKEVKKKAVVTSAAAIPASAKKNEKNSTLHHSLKESGKYVALNTLQFGVNQYKEVDAQEFNVIMQMADQLMFNESLKISIAGFTDNTGSLEYNVHLSMLRAQNIKQYLIELGVNESRIMVSANGVSNPAASNDTSEGRSANRRVEMLLIPS